MKNILTIMIGFVLFISVMAIVETYVSNVEYDNPIITDGIIEKMYVGVGGSKYNYNEYFVVLEGGREFKITHEDFLQFNIGDKVRVTEFTRSSRKITMIV